MTAAARVELIGVSKRFGRVLAASQAHLTARAGEVHAVVGENGAGKSTLMKILYGLVEPDAGRVLIDGQPRTRHTTREAIRAGIGMVFQHFMLVEPLTVLENLALGREPTVGPFLDRRRAAEEVRAISRRFGLDIEPERTIASCSVGLQQRVEILKVLARGAEVIILDEPTAVLTPQESDALIETMRRLAREGKTVLLVTHKLREVMAAADRVTIMRRGETIETLDVVSTSVDALAEKMVGRRLVRPARRPRLAEPGPLVLAVERLEVSADRTGPGVEGVTFDLRAGEVLGLAGIEGNGQTELIECLAGLRPARAGCVRLLGEDVTHASVAKRFAFGLAHVPEDRHARAVVLELSVEENVILGDHRAFTRALGIDRAKMRNHARTIIAQNDVRPPDPTLPIGALSGGNQQKIVIGRELARAPRVLLAAHPTRGLDIGASEHVFASLDAARQQGTATLLVSADLSELLTFSDRLLVMYGGRVVGEVDPARVDERELGRLMVGKQGGEV